MAHIDLKQRAVQAKLVYYGPGLCGKTTNLEYINRHLAKDQELMSLATEGDRTIFFDFMPLELGQLRGLDVRVKLYTVPGQVRYNETRKMVLKNVDGLVFVADSQEQMMDANLESFDNMFSNLSELGIRADDLAIILQYNKRDLPEVLAPEVLDAALNGAGYPRFLASARTGDGVTETLKEACRQMLRRLMTSLPEREDPKVSAAREESRVAHLGEQRGSAKARPPSSAKQPAAKSPAAGGGMAPVPSQRRPSGEQTAVGDDRQTLIGVPEPAHLPAKRPRSAVGEQRRLPSAPRAAVPPAPPPRPAPPPPPPPPRPPSSPEAAPEPAAAREAHQPEAEAAVPVPPPAAAAAPAELAQLETLQLSLGRILEQVTVTERSLKAELEALRSALPGGWKTELVAELLDRLPGKTEVHQMGLTLQQLVNQTVGVDLSTLQAQLLHLSAVREEMKALRKSVDEMAEKTAASPAPAGEASPPGKAEVDLIVQELRAQLGRPSQPPALLRQLPGELTKLREDIARLTDLVELKKIVTPVPGPTEPRASSGQLPADLAEKVAGLAALGAELASLPTKTELAQVAEKVAALRGELALLPTKAELAELADKVAALPDRAELAALRAELANLPTKAELAKVMQRLAAQPPARAPAPPVETKPGPKPEPVKAEAPKVDAPPESAKAEAPPEPVKGEPEPEPAPPEPVKSEAPPEPKVSAPPEPVKAEAPPEPKVSAPPEPVKAEPEPEPTPPEPVKSEAPPEPKVSAPPEPVKPEPEPNVEPPPESAKAEAPPEPKVSAPPEPVKPEPEPKQAPAEPAPKAEAEPHKAEPEPDRFKDDPAHQNAARIARVMVSDLWLYLKDQVEEGIRQGDFYERLAEALADMRGTYDSRVPQEVRDQKDHLGPTIEEFLGRKRKQLGLE